MTEGNGKPKTLVGKLSELLAVVERVPKSGYNDFHRYHFATEADIVAAVRVGMAERGLILVPDVQEMTWREAGLNKDGKPRDPICTLKVRFTVMDGESADTLAFLAVGEGQDGGDKAVYKAMTGATKYALLKLFLIPTGDDPETATEGPAPAFRAPRDGPPPPPIPRGAPKVTKPQGGGLPPITDEQADKEFPKYDPETEERKELIKEARRLADKVGLSPKDRQQAMQTYLGGKDVQSADLASLADMVKWLRTRAAE